MELEQAIRTRRTHKVYRPQPVDRATLEELFDLARWAPNHHLTNPWRFRVIGDRTRARLKLLAEARKPGSAVKLDRAPTLVLASCASEDPAQTEEDLLAAAVASYIVLLAAHGCGLAGYWRTLALLEEHPARALLDLSPNERVLGLLHLGHPRQEQRVPERAAVGEYVKYLS